MLTTTATYDDGLWHYAAATMGPAGIHLYADGLPQASNAGVTTALNTTGYYRWGGMSLSGWPARPSSDYLIGTLDEVAYYPAQLTKKQIARHYTSNH